MHQVQLKTDFYEEKDTQRKKKHDLPHIVFFVSYQVGFDLKLCNMYRSSTATSTTLHQNLKFCHLSNKR